MYIFEKLVNIIEFLILGEMETSKKEWATKGERSQTVVHSDNLKLEGQMQGMLIYLSIFLDIFYFSTVLFDHSAVQSVKICFMMNLCLLE